MELEDSEYPCSVMEGSAQYYLVESGEGTKTLNNASTTNQVFAVYESGLSYVFLGDPESLTTDVDFVASTVAINTQCKPISKQCNLDGWAGSTVTYNCSQYFNGSLADAAVTSSSIVAGTDFKMMLFNDSALEQPLDYSIFANTRGNQYLKKNQIFFRKIQKTTETKRSIQKKITTDFFLIFFFFFPHPQKIFHPRKFPPPVHHHHG